MGGDGTYTIGPGFWGFVAFFVMAIALWLLVRNMSGRLRRMAYQERERDGAGSDLKQTVTGSPAERPAPSGPVDLRSSARLRESPNPDAPSAETGPSPDEPDEPQRPRRAHDEPHRSNDETT